MAVPRNLAAEIASCEPITVEGVFERHTARNVRTLTGSTAGARWGARGAYPVLYLGRPTASVVVEAYRHLVENVEGMRPELVQPRRLLRCQVKAAQILDLRDAECLSRTGLTHDDLMSDPGDYDRCQRVGQAAHQLGLHGILAPAATRHGETLALFEQQLTPDEMPVVVSESIWETLPADPRILRAVQDADAPAS